MSAAALHFDFRAKLVVFFAAFLLAALLTHDPAVCTAIILMTIYLAVQHFTKAGLIYLLIGLGVALIRWFSGGNGISVLMPDMFLFAVLRILLVLMAAYPMIMMPPGEAVAALFKMHCPNYFALPLTFMFRFAPTVKDEFSAVFSAMRLRGLISMAHPLHTFEYTLIPIIIRSSKIADELAASAELRGIENPGPHSCLRRIEMTRKDFLLLPAVSAAVLFCLFLDRWVIS
jgi:ABC-type cobalt transport system, permease component CbiQ and related transporters